MMTLDDIQVPLAHRGLFLVFEAFVLDLGNTAAPGATLREAA